MNVLFSFFPVVVLVVLMTKRNSMPSFKALPLTAAFLYFVSLIVFQRDPNQVHATVASGLLTSWTPILIIGGAVFLFQTMNVTGGMATIQRWLNGVTTNKVAQLIIVGWAFPFLIEGASGFGTPAALAAPVLVGLGFPAVRVAMLALVMNSVPVSFGAVGTPTWFGFSNIVGISDAEILQVGAKTALTHGAAALVIPLIALSFVVKPKEILRNIGFVYLSIAATVIPYIAVAFFNFEFPALVGGLIGLIASVFFARKGWGLKNDPEEPSRQNLVEPVALPALLKAAFPIWGTLVLLVITRVPQLGVKALLTGSEPFVSASWGNVGHFWLSKSLVVGLSDIFGTSVGWSHKLLYVPSLVPFVLISLVTFVLFRSRRAQMKEVWDITTHQMKHPALALFGALVFVKLMMMGGDDSAVALIGRFLADLTGASWQVFASYLGAVGSFFSGSNTVSNLTFGGVQDSIAAASGLNRTTILAMQSVGGAMGNMVCINNIVAVCSVLALENKEGYILKRTVWPMLLYGVIAAIMSFVV